MEKREAIIFKGVYISNRMNFPWNISSPFWRCDESHYVIQEFLCHFQDIPKLAYAIRHFVKPVTIFLYIFYKQSGSV